MMARQAVCRAQLRTGHASEGGAAKTARGCRLLWRGEKAPGPCAAWSAASPSAK